MILQNLYIYRQAYFAFVIRLSFIRFGMKILSFMQNTLLLEPKILHMIIAEERKYR